MKRTLLSIGEVARLKGVSRKALRYYERIGILVPAHTDPDTGYRYYALNQMIVVDVIVTCVELGIPLKTLTRFMRSDGRLDIGSILEQGRAVALDTMRRAAASLTQIDRHLEEAAAQQRIDHEKQPYERRMEERRILCVAWDAKDFDAKRYLALTTLLYEHASDAGVVPLYQWGMARSAQRNGATWRVFVEAAALTTPVFRATDAPGDELARDGEPTPRRLTRPADEPAPENARSRKQRANGDRQDRQPSLETKAPMNSRIAACGITLSSLPGGKHRGQRIRAAGFEACFREVFQRATAIPGPLTATEVWDPEIDPADYAVEMLEGPLP
ncbi:MAG: MerR family DNA-binding transcriptional regulator [Slackia sp.]|nr:MerR family DNA-binding transcriptional regulator [Slackia sp.]